MFTAGLTSILLVQLHPCSALAQSHGNDENHYLGAAEKEEKAALAKKHCRLRQPSLVKRLSVVSKNNPFAAIQFSNIDPYGSK